MTGETELLHALADKQAITEIIHLYCRGIDRTDRALLLSLFHPDSTHKHGAFSGRSVDFIDRALGTVSGLRTTSHLIGNIVIELDGDTALTEAYYFVHHRVPGSSGQPQDDEDYLAQGRYIDRFERREGNWRIAHRTGVWDWRRWEKASDRGFYDMPASQRGARWPDDEIYARKRPAAPKD